MVYGILLEKMSFSSILVVISPEGWNLELGVLVNTKMNKKLWKKNVQGEQTQKHIYADGELK